MMRAPARGQTIKGISGCTRSGAAPQGNCRTGVQRLQVRSPPPHAAQRRRRSARGGGGAGRAAPQRGAARPRRAQALRRVQVRRERVKHDPTERVVAGGGQVQQVVLHLRHAPGRHVVEVKVLCRQAQQVHARQPAAVGLRGGVAPHRLDQQLPLALVVARLGHVAVDKRLHRQHRRAALEQQVPRLYEARHDGRCRMVARTQVPLMPAITTANWYGLPAAAASRSSCCVYGTSVVPSGALVAPSRACWMVPIKSRPGGRDLHAGAVEHARADAGLEPALQLNRVGVRRVLGRHRATRQRVAERQHAERAAAGRRARAAGRGRGSAEQRQQQCSSCQGCRQPPRHGSRPCLLPGAPLLALLLRAAAAPPRRAPPSVAGQLQLL